MKDNLKLPESLRFWRNYCSEIIISSLKGLFRKLESATGIEEELPTLIIHICKQLLIYSIMQRGCKILRIAPLNTWNDRF